MRTSCLRRQACFDTPSLHSTYSIDVKNGFINLFVLCTKQDIDKFSENLSHLYSDIAKPLVDIALFAYKLGEAM
jgi:hypothetical protein